MNSPTWRPTGRVRTTPREHNPAKKDSSKATLAAMEATRTVP